ncbi:cytochrome c oxidase subunit 3 [Andreprevotia chitinilytica]|uniref:cytochrome c oxidase subunit 3 n=1 Tax=Andreprevotia chitinilytica TaxID=396808 RepID=UPI000558D13E|nr:cytochrome c oxidase subunit 3 [Andreprevotia chitinilytica]
MTSAVYPTPPNAARVGLWILIGVLTVLFLQFIQAYAVRLGSPDWIGLPEPWLLRWNTLALLLSSVALQWALVSTRHEQRRRTQVALFAGGGLAIVFLLGQWWAWQLLHAQGYLVAGNPANSFFYLITGLHGLHVGGGLVAWVWVLVRVWRSEQVAPLAINVQLCARYWHFLLLVWLVLYGVLFLIPPATLQAICGGGG